MGIDMTEVYEAESSGAAQIRETNTTADANGDDHLGYSDTPDSLPHKTPAMINPFHQLSQTRLEESIPGLAPAFRSSGLDEEGPVGESINDPAIHITKVTPNTVTFTSDSLSGDSRSAAVVKKVNQVLGRNNERNVAAETSASSSKSPVIMQGAPPSPPISETDETDSAALESTSTNHATSIVTSNLTAEPFELTASPMKTMHLAVPDSRRASSSGSSRTGSLTMVRSGRLAPQRDEESDPPEPRQRRTSESATSNDPPIQSPRITRRSTNPSPITSPRSPLIHSHSTFAPSPPLRSQTTVPGVEGAALDSDILAQAENIRQQRLERRQKKASDPIPVKPAQREETKVLVGNLIGEDHVNYVLMYNMLTGIRIGVSRCQAKIKRPLTDEDYVARHKFSFDIVGNELTPSARYDFKFKDYAPWVFRDLRDDHFHLDPADYLLSLTAKYILSELGSPGKSGSFFYFSRDYRFIIKTISHSEHKFLRSILKDYHQHVKNNPHTLLSRFYGLHRVKLPRGRKIHFVIMNNLFPPHRDIHETYDLKGSSFGREYPEEKAQKNPRAVLKDKNWVNRDRTLELGPEKQALLTEQLRRDMEFLKKKRIMDYSLLVGIHNMERGNRDNLRENQLTVFHPELPATRRKPSTIKGHSEAAQARKAIRRSDPKMLDAASQLPTADSADRRHFLFYQDEGGLRATDEFNQNMDVIYYLGIIDICTPYNTVKRIEHFWKSMTEDRHMISCVDPVEYGHRFLDFLMSVMRGGDLSLRPPGLLPRIASQEKPIGEPQNAPVNAGHVGHLKTE
ncbi:hypothetical protein BCR39DRAFT_550308 [Naematelia encephala]|uniref:1-phosphatidylinositol-4-phosphate 5-kinase n=1 Tax=Naematelia encephala TaxID=71784 RepID=A0A1Y2AKF3_9TREE|nr:hypothetical protein BCR39DRAFT_550308 [Naematelia encephala]